MTEEEKREAFIRYATPRLNSIFDLDADDIEKQAGIDYAGILTKGKQVGAKLLPRIFRGGGGKKLAPEAVFDFGRGMGHDGGSFTVDFTQNIARGTPKKVAPINFPTEAPISDITSGSGRLAGIAEAAVPKPGVWSRIGQKTGELWNGAKAVPINAWHGLKAAPGAVVDFGKALPRRSWETIKTSPGIWARQVGNYAIKGIANTFIPKWLWRDKLVNFLLKKLPGGISDEAIKRQRYLAKERGAFDIGNKIIGGGLRTLAGIAPYAAMGGTLYLSTRKDASPFWRKLNAAYWPRIVLSPAGLVLAGSALSTDQGRRAVSWLIDKTKQNWGTLKKYAPGVARAGEALGEGALRGGANFIAHASDTASDDARDVLFSPFNPIGATMHYANKAIVGGMGASGAKMLLGDDLEGLVRDVGVDKVVAFAKSVRAGMPIAEAARVNGLDYDTWKQAYDLISEKFKRSETGQDLMPVIQELRKSGVSTEEAIRLLDALQRKELNDPVVQEVIGKLKRTNVEGEAYKFLRKYNPNIEQQIGGLKKKVNEGIKLYTTGQEVLEAAKRGEYDRLSDEELLEVAKQVGMDPVYLAKQVQESQLQRIRQIRNRNAGGSQGNSPAFPVTIPPVPSTFNPIPSTAPPATNKQPVNSDNGYEFLPPEKRIRRF